MSTLPKEIEKRLPDLFAVHGFHFTAENTEDTELKKIFNFSVPCASSVVKTILNCGDEAQKLE